MGRSRSNSDGRTRARSCARGFVCMFFLFFFLYLLLSFLCNVLRFVSPLCVCCPLCSVFLRELSCARGALARVVCRSMSLRDGIASRVTGWRPPEVCSLCVCVLPLFSLLGSSVLALLPRWCAHPCPALPPLPLDVFPLFFVFMYLISLPLLPLFYLLLLRAPVLVCLVAHPLAVCVCSCALADSLSSRVCHHIAALFENAIALSFGVHDE